MKIIIATIKSWNISNCKYLKDEYKDKHEIILITQKNNLNYAKVKEIEPDYIFFPHWSWMIPEEIYENYNCVVFHITDLPFGRGGSPLQNLIVRGIENTKVSAIRVSAEIDAGEIYFKEDLNLNGTAEEIFIRASKVIFKKMIPCFLNEEYIECKQQTGEVVTFKRRKESESEIKQEFELDKIYDYIRMLDAEGYPNAYIKFGRYKINFSRATLRQGKLIADAEFLLEDE